MSKSKRSQQRYAKSWIGQTHLNEFFSRLSTQSQQPIIDVVDAASDVESDTIELGWCKYRYREVEKKTTAFHKPIMAVYDLDWEEEILYVFSVRFPSFPTESIIHCVQLLAGLAIVLGVPFPIWLYFKGEEMCARNPLTRASTQAVVTKQKLAQQ